jgi:hypothetical protein
MPMGCHGSFALLPCLVSTHQLLRLCIAEAKAGKAPGIESFCLHARVTEA